jgi:hypothetical protein
VCRPTAPPRADLAQKVCRHTAPPRADLAQKACKPPRATIAHFLCQPLASSLVCMRPGFPACGRNGQFSHLGRNVWQRTRQFLHLGRNVWQRARQFLHLGPTCRRVATHRDQCCSACGRRLALCQKGVLTTACSGPSVQVVVHCFTITHRLEHRPWYSTCLHSCILR